MAGSDRGYFSFVLGKQLSEAMENLRGLSALCGTVLSKKGTEKLLDERPNKIQLVSLNARVGIPKEVTSIR